MFKHCCFVVAAGLWHYTLKKSRLSTRTSSYMLLFSPFLCFSLTITAYFTTQLSYTACHFLCYLSSSEIPVYSKYIVHNFVDWCCADICHWQKGLFNSSVMYKLIYRFPRLCSDLGLVHRCWVCVTALALRWVQLFLVVFDPVWDA